MRDPAATLAFEGTDVVRRLKQALTADHFLHSDLARDLVRAGRLLPFEITGSVRVSSRRIPFVSYPFLWCDAQLYDAGQLTLQLAGEAIVQGFELKDASAWNVLFVGSRPVFCDLLSFEPAVAKEWWAFGQFARHFVLPLLLARQGHMHGHQAFALWRDGVPPDVAAHMTGWKRYAGRYWPLMARPPRHMDAQIATRCASIDMPVIARFRARLHASLDWMITGVAPPVEAPSSTRGWADYESSRHHYSAQALDVKRTTVARWLAETGPGWVLDLGCNAGEFSQLALDAGASVVAMDGSHNAVQTMYRRARGNEKLFPVLALIDDLPGGRGWESRETFGLFEQLLDRFDLVMMLAVIHHLAIGAAVSLPRIASMARQVTRRWLIVELIDAGDSQAETLCSQFRRKASEFGIAAQRAVFADAGLVERASIVLPGMARTLVLLEKAAI